MWKIWTIAHARARPIATPMPIRNPRMAPRRPPCLAPPRRPAVPARPCLGQVGRKLQLLPSGSSRGDCVLRQRAPWPAPPACQAGDQGDLTDHLATAGHHVRPPEPQHSSARNGVDVVAVHVAEALAVPRVTQEAVELDRQTGPGHVDGDPFPVLLHKFLPDSGRNAVSAQRVYELQFENRIATGRDIFQRRKDCFSPTHTPSLLESDPQMVRGHLPACHRVGDEA